MGRPGDELGRPLLEIDAMMPDYIKVKKKSKTTSRVLALLPDSAITELCADLRGSPAGDKLADIIHAMRDLAGEPAYEDSPGCWQLDFPGANDHFPMPWIAAFTLLGVMVPVARSNAAWFFYDDAQERKKMREGSDL